MAGFDKFESGNRTQTNRWVKPQWLIDENIDFCITDARQDHFNEQGTPQMTFVVSYVYEGEWCNREFDVDAKDWRVKQVTGMRMFKHEDGHVGFPFHHLRLIRRPIPKTTFKVLTFEDFPGKEVGDPCPCQGAGVIDPEDPSTWTPHYEKSFELNRRLTASRQPLMDTSSMTVENLDAMLKIVPPVPEELDLSA